MRDPQDDPLFDSFTVAWIIDIDAANPREAAEVAKDIQQDRTSDANVFLVTDHKGGVHQIDLDEDLDEILY